MENTEIKELVCQVKLVGNELRDQVKNIQQDLVDSGFDLPYAVGGITFFSGKLHYSIDNMHVILEDAPIHVLIAHKPAIDGYLMAVKGYLQDIVNAMLYAVK